MPLNLRYTTSLNGGMVFTGNTLGLSQDTDLYQPGVQGNMGAFTSLNLANQVNSFPAGTTLNYLQNGSRAQLVLPAGSTVVRAELIWGAIYAYDYIFTGNPEPPASGSIAGLINNPVLFNGVSVNPDPTTGQQFTNFATGFATVQWYMRSADVTALVQANGAGTYSVEQVPAILTNISNYTIRTGHVGWTLAVVYENPAQEYTNVYLYVGSQGVTVAIGSTDIGIGGFETLPTGAVTTKLFLSTQEGDADISGDQALFGPNVGSLTALSSPVNAIGNFFGGIITDSSGNLDTSGTFGTRNNNTLINANTFGSRHGWDINTRDVSSLMTNSQTDAVLRITTTGDAYMVNALGLTTNNVRLDATLTKGVDLSIAEVGDELEYSYLIQNNGNVTMTSVVVTDSVPIETTFVPGSAIVNGAPNIGANPGAGISVPDIAPGATATITFRVTVDSMPNPNTVLNTGTLNYEYGGITIPPTTISNEVQTIILEPFVCDTFIYQVVAPIGQNSELRKINAVTGDVEIVNIDLGAEINAIGYNILNNYIYGVKTVLDTGGNPLQRNLVQIDALGNVADLGPIPNVTDITGLNVGAIDNQGFYYLKRSNRDYYWTVDLRPGSPTYGQLVDPTNGYIATTSSTPILPAGTLTNGDWTYNINDGLLYSINDTSTQFITMDPTTGQTNLLPTEAGLPLDYGAMASDGQGFIYGIDNVTGDVVRWQNVGGTMQGELFSQTLGTIRNDATMCLNAIIELDFGDAPDTSVGTSTGNYRTLLSNDGPRHQIINELFVGQAVTAEIDGLQNPIATGDIDDGFVPPVQIPIAIGNFSVPVNFTNNTGQTANIYAWIDYNQDGIFQTNESFTTTIPSQVGVQIVNLNFVGIPTTLDTDTFMRVRITTETLVNTGGPTAEDTRSFGAALDGDVEDYLVEMFGDAELTVVKSQSVNIVDVGDTITYTIDITNIGNVEATNSFLTDIVPNGTSYVPGTLTVDTILSGDNLATGVTLPSPILPGQIVTVEFDIIIDEIPVPNPIVNVADVDYLSNGLPLAAQSNQVTATVNTADLSIIKIANPDPVNAGEQIVYTLLINNAGPNNAENVNLTDIIPAQLSGVQYSLNGGTTWLPWSGNLSLGTIAVFTSITVLIRGNVAASATGNIVNTADVTSTTADPNLGNNTDTVITRITQLADISVIKTGSPDPVIAGEELVYTLVVNNVGPSNASNVNLIDVIPLNGAEYSLNAGLTWSLWTGNLALGTMIPGQTVNVLVRGIVIQDTVGSIDNTATVTSTTADPVPGNNTDTITTNVDTLADLRIVKTATPDPVIAGEQLVYTLVVSNIGPSDALNVDITDVMLPNNAEFSLDNGLSWNPWLGNINIGTLGANAIETILLRGDVPVDILGNIDNTATVTSITPDPVPGNNTDTVTTNVDTLADISIIKDTLTNPVIAGAQAIYSFTITNDGPSNALNVNLSDVIVLDNPEYSLNNGITWSVWGGNLNVGTIIVGSSLTVLIRGIVLPDTVGDLVNTATVLSPTPDPNLNNNTDTVTDNVEQLADISVIKGITPDPVVAGTLAVYDLIVSNNGPSDATDVILTDAVPLSTPEYSLNNGVTWSAWTGSINLGTIVTGAQTIVLIRGIVATNLTGDLINTASVASPVPDPNSTNNTDRIITPIDTIADVSIVKTVDPEPVLAGDQAIYTLTVENAGPSDALNVIVNDTVPLDNSEYSLDAGTTWIPWLGSINIGTLIEGGIANILIRGLVPSDTTGSITNTATVSSTTFDPNLTNNTDTIVTPVVTSADLSIVKTAVPNTVIAGEQLIYTLAINNNGLSDALEVTIDDIPPLDNPEYSLDDGITWLSPWSGSVNIGTLIAGDLATVLIRGIVPEDTIGSIDNTATVSSITPDPNQTNNTDTVTTLVDTLVDVSIVKTDSPDPVIAGEQLIYTLVVNNGGPSSALNVQVNDISPLNNSEYSLDGGVTWIPWIGSSSLGTLAVGETQIILIRGNVPSDLTGSIDNTATVTTTTPESNPSNNTDTVITRIETLADVNVVKTAAPNPVIAGEQLNYTLVVTNAGPSDALSVQLFDTVPLDTPQYSLNGGITWFPWPGNINLGTIVSGDAVTVQMRGIVPQDTVGSIQNIATVSSITPDPNLNNNTDSVITQVNTLADVSIVKTSAPNPVIAGEQLSYTLVASNAGPSDAQNVVVNDVSPLNSSEYSLNGGITWLPWPGNINLGTLFVASSETILLRGIVPENIVGSIDNTATVTSTTPDSDQTNNIDTVTTEVDNLADISVVKTIDTISVIAGEELIYNLVISNSGPSDALNVILNDEVPLINPEYSLNNGVTWILWPDSVNLGIIAAQGSITVLIRGIVPSDETGIIVNTAIVTTTTPDPNPTNNIDTVSVDVNESADISVIKTSTPDPVIAGEEIVYNLVVNNAGPSDATSVELIDAVLINNPEFSLNNGITWLPWIGNINLGTMVVGSSLTVLIRGTVPSSLIGNLDNIARVTSTTPDPDTSNNIDRITTEIDELADVSIIKTVDPDPVIAGAQAIYTLEVTNDGPSDAVNVNVTDAVPLDNSEYSLDNGATWFAWFGSVNIGTLVTGSTRQILIRGDVPADAIGTLTNIATVISTTPDPDTGNNEDAIVTPINELADLSIVKTALPDPGIAGEELIYTLVVNNAGPSNAQAVTINDIPPIDNQEYSVDGGLTWLLWTGSINIGTLLTGDSREILIRGTIPEDVTGNIDNTATVTSTTADPNLANNTDTVITQVDTLVDVSIVKTASPDPVIAGEELDYTLLVTNVGPSTALNVQVNDVIPLNNDEYSTDAGVTWFPWLGTLTLGTLSVNDTVTILLRGIVPTSTIGNIDNTALVSTTSTDSNPNNNTDTVRTDVDTLADLSIIKTASPDPVLAGEQLNYTLVVSNAGPSDALSVNLVDATPLNNAEYSLNGGITWILWTGNINLGTIVSSGSKTVQMRGIVPTDTIGTIENTATVTSITPDPDLSNNTDTVIAQVETEADVSIVKTASPDPVIAGEELIYTLTVANSGPSDALNVIIDDVVPLNNVEYSLNNGAIWLPWLGNVNIGTIAASQTSIILLRGIVPEDTIGEIDNTAVVSSSTPDPNLSNNTDTVTTQVNTLADISVVKNVAELPIIAGEELIYDLTVSNIGPSIAENVVLNDVVPLDSPEYSLNNGVTWIAWGGNINLETIIVGNSRVVLIRGIVPASITGNLSNTATVTSMTPDPNLTNNTDTIVNPVNSLADISVIKSAVPDPVIAGEEIIYTLLISNSGPSDALSVNLNDIVTLDNAQYSLNNGVTWNLWTGNVNVGTIVVGDSLTALIKGIVPSDIVNNLINTATVTSITEDPDTTNNTDRIITVVNELADVSIVKTINSDPVIAGTQVIYTLVATNEGPSDAVDVTITDVVPLNDPEYSLNNGISWVQWFGSVNIGDLVVGDSVTMLIRGDVPSNATGNLVNTADVASLTQDPDITNNKDTVVTPIEELADLEIIKTTTPLNRTLGDEVIYDLVITNNGPSDAQNVSLQDSVPVELLTQEFSLDEGLTWSAWSTPYSVGTIIAGDSITVLIRGIVADDARGIVSNTGVVTSTTEDPNLSNNTSTADIDVLYADLISPGNFIKDLDKEYADIGEEITYTISVTNTGNTSANNVIITDTIPVDTSYVANSLTIDGIPNLSNPETGITLLTPIVPNQTVIIKFKVLVERIPVPNPIPNKATVDYTYTVDPQNPNSEAVSGQTNEVFTQVNNADLIGDNGENFVKSVDKLFTNVDEEITYTISVTNTGNVEAENVVITDLIPNGTSYVLGSLLVDGVSNLSNPGVGITLATPIVPNQTVIIKFKVLVEEIPVPNPIPNKGTVDYTYTVDPANPNAVSDSGETNEVFTKVNNADLIGDNGENFVKSVDKAYADIGEEITYTIDITNTGNVNANNVVLTDIIPNGTSYVVGSLLVNGILNPSNPELGINLAPIGPNQTRVVQFKVLVEEIPVPNPIPNTGSITYTYTVDPAIPNEVVDGGITNEVLTKVNNATIESEKFVNKVYSDVGEEITYTIDVKNTGNVNANNVVLTDIIPNGTSYVVGSLRVNGGINLSNPETGIILNSIIPGATTTLIFKVLVEEIPVPNPIPNKATGIFTYTVDPAQPNVKNGEFETNTVETQVNNADLIGENGENFVKTVDKQYADIGEEITYTVSVKNTGNVPANNVVITDPIPNGTSFVNGSLTVSGFPNLSNPENGIVLANPIQPDNTVIIVFKVLVEEIPVPNPIPNKAFVEYTYTVDPANINGVTDSGETNEVFTQINNADLIGENGENFVKSVDKKFTDTEKTLTYTISVTNTGNVNANNVVIKDPIPNDTTYVIGSLRVNGVANPSNPETGIILAKPIAPSETITIVFKVFVEDIPTPNPIPNKAFVEYTYTVDPAKPNAVTDSGETNEVFTKVNDADLIIIKSSDEEYKDLGDTVLYTVEIFNDGNVPANNVFFTDDLPSELKFVTDSVFIDGVNFIGYDPKVGFSLPSIAPLTTRVVTFEALVIEAPKNLSVKNIAVVNYTHIVDPNLPEIPDTKTSNADIITISHGEISKEGLVKGANKKRVTEGDIIKYTVEATNSGNVPINKVVLRDVLPLGVDFIVGTVTINGVGAPLQNPNTGINLSSINAGETVKVAFDVKVRENPPTELVNTATVDYEYTVDPNEPPVEKTQESNEVKVDVVIPKVILEKSANIAVATVGDIITYTLVAKNTGEIDVFDVIVKDLLEPDVNFVEESVKIDGVSFTNENILTGINIGTLVIGQAKTITFEAKVVGKTNDFIENISTGVYSFIVDLGGPTRINSFESNLNKIPLEKYELTIEKIANKSIATLNEIITYSVNLKNTGEVELLNILFKDELPKNLEFVENSFKLNGVTINDVSLDDGVNVGVLNPGDMAFISYQAKVISGSLTGYSINNAYAEFDYKLSNDVKGSDQTEIVQAIVEIPISSFKQMIVNTDICIPDVNPDIEELDDAVARIEIVDSYVVDVMEEVSNEGQILTGKKLIVHGYMYMSVKYTALVEDQAMHSAERVISFSNFIMLPNVYEDEKLEVSSIIEDIDAQQLCCRKVAIAITLMLRAGICAY